MAAREWLESWSTMVLTSTDWGSPIAPIAALRSSGFPAHMRLPLDTTETFKQKKQQLAREGLIPEVLKDQLFFRDPKSGAYRSIDAAAYWRILEGSIGL